MTSVFTACEGEYLLVTFLAKYPGDGVACYRQLLVGWHQGRPRTTVLNDTTSGAPLGAAVHIDLARAVHGMVNLPG